MSEPIPLVKWHEIVGMCRAGATNRDISDQMRVSVRTIHRLKIMHAVPKKSY